MDNKEQNIRKVAVEINLLNGITWSWWSEEENNLQQIERKILFPPKSVNFKDFARGEVRAKREMINEVTVKLLQD